MRAPTRSSLRTRSSWHDLSGSSCTRSRGGARVTQSQSYGERMMLHDAASRGQEDVINDVADAMRITHRRIH